MVGDAMCAACQRIYLQCRTHIDNREHPGAIVKHKGKNKKRSRRVIGVERCELMLVHCSRHTFATMELTMGADLYTTSKLLGHTEVRTTQIYAKIINKKKDEAVSLLDSAFEE